MFPQRLRLMKRFFSSTSDHLVIRSEDSGVRKLVMNSPSTRNALSMDMMSELQDNLADAPSLRCVIISAVGHVFSSGHNLKQLARQSSPSHEETFVQCGRLCLQISTLPVPVLAVVDGIAAAAGCQLAASCDIVIATDESQFSTPGANFGLFCSAPGVAISRSVNRKAAAKMVLTGLPVPAAEALQMGLISAVCPKESLDETIEVYINAIKSKSKEVIALGKKFFYSQMEQNISTAYREAAKIMTDNLKLPDGQEGLRSFVEKRKPVWKDSS